MESPPQSTHLLLTRLCSQMEVPPQSLQTLLRRLCSQMEVPPQSLHLLLTRFCSQMEVPPAVLAFAPLSVVLADGGAPHSPCIYSCVGCARRWRRPRSPCTDS
jgi:hypothetical protein